jgi:drug/metabolite transporter (DMT)-like permease
MTQASERTGALYAAAMLVSGTFSTVIMKTEYGVRSHGTEQCTDPQDATKTTTLCPFDKPWFGVLQMKLAMALCLVFLFVRKAAQHKSYLETPLLRTQKGGKKYIATPEAATIRNKHKKQATAQETTALLRGEAGADQAPGRLPLKTVLAVALPSLLDLLQTVGANVGLLWISSSVYQMARGSVIIFSAFLSVRLMGKRLYAYHYASIALVAISVVLVGWAGTTDSSASAADSSHALFGLIFIVLAQLLTALQIVVEEHLMLELNLSPMLLVGLEGLWGLAFFVVLVPVLSLTPATSTAFAKIWHEDFYDSTIKIWNSPTLAALIVAYVVAVGTLNVTANYVTKHLSAVMRSIAEVHHLPSISCLRSSLMSSFLYRHCARLVSGCSVSLSTTSCNGAAATHRARPGRPRAGMR